MDNKNAIKPKSGLELLDERKALSDKIAKGEAYVPKRLDADVVLSEKQLQDRNFVQNQTSKKWFYKDGLDELEKSKVRADYTLKKQQAEEQGFWGELGAFATQAVAGEIVLGTLEGIGYLLDFEEWGQTLTGQERDWDNWFSSAMASAKEGVREFAPIYEDPDNANRGFWDNLMYGDGWFASGAVSVASAASMMIPVAGWVRGTALLGKALATAGKAMKAGSTLSKIAKGAKIGMGAFDDVAKGVAKSMGAELAPNWASNVGKGIYGGFVSRHLESTMEATQIYREKYDEYIQKGFTEEEAKKAAGKGAEFTYKHDMALLLTDIPQFLIMGAKGWSPNKAITSMKLAKQEGTSKLAALARAGWSPVTQFASEGFEEATQFVIGEEGKYVADVHAGLKQARDNSWGAMFKRNLHEAELWKSAFFGGFGGIVSGPALRGAEKAWGKVIKGNYISENAARIEEAKNRFTTIASNINTYKEAVAEGNERGAAVAKSRIAATTAINAANVGNFDSMVASLEALKKATPEELSKWYKAGLDEKATEEFKANIDEFIAEVKRVGEIHTKNANMYASKGVRGLQLASTMSYTQALKENFEKREKELDSLIPLFKNSITGITALSPGASELFEAKLKTLTAKRVVETAKRLADNAENDKDKEYWENKIKESEEAITANLNNIKELEASAPTLNVNDKRVLAELENPGNIDLIKAYSEKEFLADYILKFTQELKNYDDIINGNTQDPLETSSVEEEIVDEDTDELQTNDLESQLPVESISFEQFNDLDNTSKTAIVNAIVDKIKNTRTTLEDIPDNRIKALVEKKLKPSSEVQEEETSQEPELETEEVTELPPVEGFETVETPEITLEEGEDTYITSKLTPLAWKSIHNNTVSLEDLESVNNVALSSLLENGFNPKDHYVKFQLDLDYLDSNPNLKEQVMEAMRLKTIPNTLLGIVPIKAIIHKDGKPLEMQVQDPKSKKIVTHQPYMHLHDDVFFLEGKNPEVVEQQMEVLRTHKQLILNNLMKGITTVSQLTDITDGNLNVIKGEDVRNSLEEVTGIKAENLTLVYGQQDGKYYLERSRKALLKYSSATPGAVYTLVRTNSGNLIPLRLKTSKLTKSEATLIYDLMVKELLEPKTGLGKEIINSIRNSADPRVSKLSTYLNLEEITSDELLDHLIYKGTKANRSNKKTTLVYGEINNVPGFTVGDLKARLTKENIKNATTKNNIINSLTTNRVRQVDIKYLTNPKYKKYLNDTGVLSSNIAKNHEAPMFIQPVVSYSSTFTTEKLNTVLVDFKSQVNKSGLSKEELESLNKQISDSKELTKEEKQDLLLSINIKLADLISKKVVTVESSIESKKADIEGKLGHKDNVQLFKNFVDILQQFKEKFPNEAKIIAENAENLKVFIVGGTTDINRNNEPRGDLDVVFLHQNEVDNLQINEFGAAIQKLQYFITDMGNNTQQPAIESNLRPSEKSSPIDISNIISTELTALESAEDSRAPSLKGNLQNLATSLSNRLGVTMEVASSQEVFNEGVSTGQALLDPDYQLKKARKLEIYRKHKIKGEYFSQRKVDWGKLIVDINNVNRELGYTALQLLKTTADGQHTIKILPRPEGFQPKVNQGLKPESFNQSFVSLQEALESGLHAKVFNELGINSVEDLNKLTPIQLGEVLMKICK